VTDEEKKIISRNDLPIKRLPGYWSLFLFVESNATMFHLSQNHLQRWAFFTISFLFCITNSADQQPNIVLVMADDQGQKSLLGFV
jgi:hypothetical protein